MMERVCVCDPPSHPVVAVVLNYIALHIVSIYMHTHAYIYIYIYIYICIYISSASSDIQTAKDHSRATMMVF